MKFAGDQLHAGGSDNEWRATWHWAVNDIGDAPEVYRFFDSGISDDIPTLTEQLIEARKSYPPRDAGVRGTLERVLMLLKDQAGEPRVIATTGEPNEIDELKKTVAELSARVNELSARVNAGGQLYLPPELAQRLAQVTE